MGIGSADSYTAQAMGERQVCSDFFNLVIKPGYKVIYGFFCLGWHGRSVKDGTCKINKSAGGFRSTDIDAKH
jgi:hypothetical protein